MLGSSGRELWIINQIGDTQTLFTEAITHTINIVESRANNHFKGVLIRQPRKQNGNSQGVKLSSKRIAGSRQLKNSALILEISPQIEAGFYAAFLLVGFSSALLP